MTKVSESEEDKENSTVIKFVNILDSLCQRMTNCELIHFELVSIESFGRYKVTITQLIYNIIVIFGIRNAAKSIFQDNGTDLLDVIPESQEKVHILKEAMTVYEALIGYKICSWNKQSENCGQIINGLFQGYNRLLHFVKV